jgi:CRP-like cAMP-binding protein
MTIVHYFPTLDGKPRRVIPLQIMREYKAKLVSTPKGQVLFERGAKARDFFQVQEGQIRMFILNPEGQEFTQGIFNPGESFGEPPLLGDFSYPSTAVAITDANVWRLPKRVFIQLLRENFHLHIKLDQVLCKRLEYKSMVLTEVSSYDPEHRLMTILEYFKRERTKLSSEDKVVIPFTRQQLADMTGLRVETVIRAIKKMEKDGKIALQNHKIQF